MFNDSKSNNDLCKQYREDYEKYYKSIQSKLPISLNKYYSEEYSGFPNRFHDCFIAKIVFKGLSQYFKNENDNLEIILELGHEIEYRLLFTQIRDFKVNVVVPNSDKYKKCFFGEILLCEVGLLKDKIYTFNVFTSMGIEIYLEFKKIAVQKSLIRN